MLFQLFGCCEDLGETLCPPDWAGIVDVTQRVAAESSFALAKGNVKGNGILGTPSQLTIPASRWSGDDLHRGRNLRTMNIGNVRGQVTLSNVTCHLQNMHFSQSTRSG